MLGFVSCLLNRLRSGNVFLTSGAGEAPSCWTAPLYHHHRHVSSITRLIPRHRSPPICFLSFLSLFLNISFFQGNSDHFPSGGPSCSLLLTVAFIWKCRLDSKPCPPSLTPIPLHNWQPPTPSHTHRIPIMAADVAHLAPGLSHYSWLALMFCSPLALSAAMATDECLAGSPWH